MLTPSRLYSFLDTSRGFSLHFFEGQKLIYDLAMTHTLKGSAFSFFRSSVLSFVPMISFLKHGEGLGIYVDSENPYLRLKIETNYAGHLRTLLIPEELAAFPETMTGQVRVTKLFPHNKNPYTSVVEFENTPASEVVNRVIHSSYQVNSMIYVSEAADQSVLISKLPALKVDSVFTDSMSSLKDFFDKNKAILDQIFEQGLNEMEPIVSQLEQNQFTYLSSRQVQFFCPCSKEKMSESLGLMYRDRLNELFQNDLSLELKCDYCKKTYTVTPADLTPPTFN
jgi:molecular chaperone Hsp33